MKVRRIVFGCLAAAMAWTSPVLAEDITSGDYIYEMNQEGMATIKKYMGEEDCDLLIPNEIDGITVTAIGKEAFCYTEFVSVSIPEGICEIEEGAFRNVVIEENLALPTGMILGKKSFYGSSLPGEVVIPAGTQIKGEAFRNCSIETEIVIPDSVTLEQKAFYSCKLPESIAIPAGTVIEDECFAYSEGAKYLQAGDGAVFEDEVFRNNKNLEMVVIGNDVVLGDKDFYSCDKLQSVYIAERTEVGDDAFSYCNKLTKAYIAESAEVSEDAFIGCEVTVSGYETPSYEGTANEQKPEAATEAQSVDPVEEGDPEGFEKSPLMKRHCLQKNMPIMQK